MVYLDFVKAFDSVNRRFLPAKMKPFGIDGNVFSRYSRTSQVGRIRNKSAAFPLARPSVYIAWQKFQLLVRNNVLAKRARFPVHLTKTKCQKMDVFVLAKTWLFEVTQFSEGQLLTLPSLARSPTYLNEDDFHLKSKGL